MNGRLGGKLKEMVRCSLRSCGKKRLFFPIPFLVVQHEIVGSLIEFRSAHPIYKTKVVKVFFFSPLANNGNCLGDSTPPFLPSA